jgi:hypothetical protein
MMFAKIKNWFSRREEPKMDPLIVAEYEKANKIREFIVVVPGLKDACARRLKEMGYDDEFFAIAVAHFDLVRVWSFEHDAWWRPDHRGYTSSIEEAGLYPRSEAEEICRKANYCGTLNEEIAEVNLTLKDKARRIIRQIGKQDNAATAFPYFVAVQELQWFPCENGSRWGEDVRERIFVDDVSMTQEEFRKHCIENADEAEDRWEDDMEEQWEINHYEETSMWVTRAVFLTREAAEKFVKSNHYHFGETRFYIEHAWRNRELETIIEILEDYCGVKVDRRGR